MAKAYHINIWKKAPFLRLLLPVIAGIILEFYFRLQLNFIISLAAACVLTYIIFYLLPLVHRFKLQAVGGIIITIFMVNAGCFILWQKDIRNHSNWYGNFYNNTSYIIATITEPPIEKNKSFKVIADVARIVQKDTAYNTTGKLLLYFAKDSFPANIGYGSKLIIKKQIQEIKNSGNPAAFNYARYCAFRQIFHQAYLKRNNWILLDSNRANGFRNIIFSTQKFVVGTLNKYINGNDESALAKALLIGYKIDLDKDLVQAYSNVGVVHLIAISGLHLALIYALLLWIISKIPYLKKSKIGQLIVILLCLWFFALLTGASASVLRSAVMFTFIAAGNAFNKKASIYNSLCASALLLLCYDPFMLWDVGFQLSYCAVLGIVVAQKYIGNWFYFKNKIARWTWQLASVSLAAQLFTLPICLFYFHQLPLLFLLSNLIAIPLSTLIPWGCLALIFIPPVHIVALYLGKLITVIIWLLNHSVLFINALPFSLWDGISFSVAETVLLYFVIIFFLYWLLRKDRLAFKFALGTTLLFVTVISFKKWEYSTQKKMIVYDVPAHKAIDFISGNSYQFVGDSDLATNGLLQNFHLKPGRISLMLNKRSEDTNILYHKGNFYQFYNKKIAIIDTAIIYQPSAKKINVDYIIISKNPKLYISSLVAVFNCSVYIFDSSNPMWKIDKWKKDCEDLHLRFHSVPEQGAFITDL
ncbi:MAG: ComEC family competence protein [Bacteroidota bacterium]|nr:ComEC family competence protein [Bacteroidota bacterium]